MKLKELIKCDYDIEIKGIKINSKEVEDGDLFVCVDIGTLDRHEFIDDAINRGCSAVIAKRDVGQKNVPILVVSNPNEILNEMCAKIYDNPEKKLYMIGVTGTDGKTSVSTMIQTLIGNEECGYIGTNGYSCSKFNKSTNNTTPDATKLFGYLDEFVKSNCKYCSMEASSEALMRGRLKGIDYDISILTNITSEHLNSHGTIENYVKEKCKLFKQTKKDGYCILNKDDDHFDEVKKCCNGKVLTYGKSSDNDLYFKDVKLFPGKSIFKIVYKNNEYLVNSPMAAMFNVYNLSAAILTLFTLGYSFEHIESHLPLLHVSGRLEMIDEGQNFYVMVDYAHTTNGVGQLLNYAHTLDVNRVITVIGQAGERDAYKRKEVGEIVARNSDIAIFTYEDPRSEDPKDIINMMIENIKDLNNYEIIIDRSQAIKRAIDIAKEKDIVLILGKGNETYEKLKDKVIYFNDIEEAKKHLENRLITIK